MKKTEQNFRIKRKYSKSVKPGRVFAVSIDGSEHAQGAFNIVSRNFLDNEDLLIAVYIYNSKKDNDFNYRNKKEIIVNNYRNQISESGLLSTCTLILEDHNYTKHALEQVNRIAAENNAAYLFCGFYGMKGPRGDNNELTKGIDYMLKSASEPLIIIKDITERQNKKNKHYNWLFILDSVYIKGEVILDKFLPLVDIEDDEVHALVLTPSNNRIFAQDSIDMFHNAVEKHEIRKHSFESLCYEMFYASEVNAIVNFGEVQYDFVVLFNNTQKYVYQGITSDNAQIVSKAQANICVYNHFEL